MTYFSLGIDLNYIKKEIRCWKLFFEIFFGLLMLLGKLSSSFFPRRKRNIYIHT